MLEIASVWEHFVLYESRGRVIMQALKLFPSPGLRWVSLAACPPAVFQLTYLDLVRPWFELVRFPAVCAHIRARPLVRLPAHIRYHTTHT